MKYKLVLIKITFINNDVFESPEIIIKTFNKRYNAYKYLLSLEMIGLSKVGKFYEKIIDNSKKKKIIHRYKVLENLKWINKQ